MRGQGLRIRPLVEAGDVAVGVHDLRGHRLAVVDRQREVDAEELGRREDADLLAALSEDAQRTRLDAAGRQPGAQAAAEQRRDGEADHAVEEPAGLLRVHEVVVDPARTLESGLHGGRGDLGEGDAAEAVLGPAEQFAQMPGDGLALTVEVGGEVDGAVPTESPQVSYHF